MRPHWHQGFTLIEMIIAIAVAAILVAIAVPSFLAQIDKNQVKSAADELYAQLQFARSEAVKRNRTVRVYFKKVNADGTQWCYGLKVNAACNCQQTDDTAVDYCEIDGVRKSVSNGDHNSITIANGTDPFGGVVSFNPMHGTAAAGNAEFESGGGRKIRVTVSNLGRIRLCSPTGTGNILDYPQCP